MCQLNENQLRLFARTIMPFLYRLQERHDSRTKPMGGVYHLNDPEDYAAIEKMAIKFTDANKAKRMVA